MDPPIPPDMLRELYKIAIDEYRFEVKLGWDRAMYYLIFNSAILSVATGLLKLENAPVVYGFICAIYLLGIGTSLMGAQAVTKSHEYYRRTVVKKTVIEDMLGLTTPRNAYAGHTLTIGTTPGQGEMIKILEDRETWVVRPLRAFSIMYWIRGLLILLTIMNACGFAVAGYMFLRPQTKPLELPVTRIIPVVMRHGEVRHLKTESSAGTPQHLTRAGFFVGPLSS